MSDTLLATTVTAVARAIGDHLPAAFGLEPGEVRVAGNTDDHLLPDGAVAVRWPLGEDAHLVVALTADAADLLQAQTPDGSLAAVLTPAVQGVLEDLAVLLEDAAPALGEGTLVPAEEALADGPGDPVSVALDDAGTHRATVGLRMVVSDDLVAVLTGSDDPVGDVGQAPVAADVAAAAGVPLQAPSMPAAGTPQPTGPAEAVPAPAAAVPGPGVVGRSGSGGGPRPGRPPLHAPAGDVHPADFGSFDHLAALPGPAHSMSLLGDVELGVTAELGRTELTVRDVLGLTPGSIIELDRAAGSPVDVVVNGTLIARGEVVVIDEEFGIRITEILGMTDEANPFPMAQ